MPEPDAEIGKGPAVGAYLRSVREAQGLQLDEASKVTRISKSYLVAIEEGHFEKLPNPAYIKGFLRLYAGYLSLSGDEVVRRYEEAAAPPPPPQIERPPERPGVKIMERAKGAGPGRWAIPALLLVLVIVAAVFFSEQDDRPVRPAQQAPQVAAKQPLPAAPAAKPVAQTQMTSAAARAAAQGSATQSAEQLPPPAVQPGGVVLRLRFNRDSWLSITIDDSISQRYDLKAGDVIEWKGSKGFVLDLGDGGAVEAELNGRPVRALGEAGKPAHVELKG